MFSHLVIFWQKISFNFDHCIWLLSIIIMLDLHLLDCISLKDMLLHSLNCMPKMFEKERWVVYLDWIYDNENTKKKEKKKKWNELYPS